MIEILTTKQIAMANQFRSAAAAADVSNFGNADYMAPSFTGIQYPYSNIAMMNYMPPAGRFNNVPSMYAPSNMSSQLSPSAANGAVGYTNMPTLSNGNFLNQFNLGPGQTPDVISEEDHSDTMPNGDVFFTQDGDYMAD